MANKLPCPNPMCTHEFTQAELQAASQVACPKCGFRMQGRSDAPGKPAPVKPAPVRPAPVKQSNPPKPGVKPTAPPVAMPIPTQAKPVATAPLAQPIPQPKPAAVNPPLAAPIPAAPPKPATNEEAPGDSFFNPESGGGGTLVRQRGRPKQPFNWMRLLIITCVVGFAASIVIIAIVLTLSFFLGSEGLANLGGQQSADGTIYWYNIRTGNGSEKVLKVVVPRDVWEIDKEMQSRLEATSAWKMKEDDLWFAVVVKDYDMQKPRDAQMVKVAIDRLETHFGEALELAAKAEPADFGDLKAQKLQFKGQARSANWLGECLMFFKDGVGYWVFVASPEWDKIAAFEEEMASKRIFAAVERRGWREQPWPMQTFNSEKGLITMTAPKGVWDSLGEAKNVDENGILLLAGTYLAEKNNRKNAQLLAFTFEKKDNLESAANFAREYIEKKEDNENKNFKIVIDDDTVKGQGKTGTSKNVGNRPGRVIELKRLFNDEPKRYFMLAVVNDPETAYGILCECSWEHRQIWRQDFLDILASMKIRKAE
ncbi:MAG TPA: hypothetical protein VFE62_11120 [Gemmataceae bacterium]|nr:hypothetical protein [Gemmataceae bacterium]